MRVPSQAPSRPERPLRPHHIRRAVLGLLALGLVLLAAVTPAGGDTSALPVPAGPVAPSTSGPLGRRGPRPGHLAGTVDFTVFRLPQGPRRNLAPNAPDLAYAGLPDAPLLIFLPATGAVPEDYQRFLSTAARTGYSVLGLDYWNLGKSMTRTCGKVADCYTLLLRNRFSGHHPNRFSRVDAANSIEQRIRLALRTLATRQPNADWGRFLADGAIQWNRIVLAGHSQGGGESAFIAHEYQVHGVLMFSSPVATYQRVVATWMLTAGKTPPTRMYALGSQDDVYARRIQRSWPHLGLDRQGPLVRGRVPTGSHRLITTLDLGDPHQAHDRTATDATPLTPAGEPTLAGTWQWMLQQTR